MFGRIELEAFRLGWDFSCVEMTVKGMAAASEDRLVGQEEISPAVEMTVKECLVALNERPFGQDGISTATLGPFDSCLRNVERT